MTFAWNRLDAELEDTIEDALRKRARRATALDEAREHDELSLPQGLARPPALVSSSAAAAEPSVPVHAGPAGETDGASLSGPSAAAALASMPTSTLRSRVRASMGARGPKHVRWTTRERAEWRELIVVRGQAA